MLTCALQPLDTALAGSVCGNVAFAPAQLAALAAILPTGLCDYAQGDARRPGNLYKHPHHRAQQQSTSRDRPFDAAIAGLIRGDVAFAPAQLAIGPAQQPTS